MHRNLLFCPLLPRAAGAPATCPGMRGHPSSVRMLWHVAPFLGMPTAIAKVAFVTTLTGGVLLLPVLRDPVKDGDRKLTLVSLVASGLVFPTLNPKACSQHLAKTPGWYQRHVSPYEKQWLVQHKMVQAHTPNTQVLLVSLACVLALLTSLGFPPQVLSSIKAALDRWGGPLPFQTILPCEGSNWLPRVSPLHASCCRKWEGGAVPKGGPFPLRPIHKDWRGLGFPKAKHTSYALARDSPLLQPGSQMAYELQKVCVHVWVPACVGGWAGCSPYTCSHLLPTPHVPGTGVFVSHITVWLDPGCGQA